MALVEVERREGGGGWGGGPPKWADRFRDGPQAWKQPHLPIRSPVRGVGLRGSALGGSDQNAADPAN